ncbi:uncharacterized protein LOC112044085 [Bicyclus anynana]|uniref:Nucleoporin NUP42 n=1 Tax=Bicyclus anynana TaxID=110368 RepID=A0A6J1MJH9_BICAN|nr:uncharacterized protein LOC112044085 [Bicyclus anynana]
MVVCKFFQRGNCYYGNSCRFDHTYDSKYSYRAPQYETTKSSHPVASTVSSGQSSSASSLFRSAVQSVSSFENASSHTFAESQPTRPSVFDRLGPQPSSNQNQARSLFAQANQNVNEQNTNVFQTQNRSSNVFQTQNQSSNVFQTLNQPSNVFQTHNQPSNVFQTHNQMSNDFQMHNQSPNVFQTNTPHNAFQSQNQSASAKSLFAQATQSIFGQQPNSNTNASHQPSSVSNSTKNVFHISNQPAPNVFSTNVFEQNQINDDDIYSKIEDLSQTDIDAFESDHFKLGFIPELPPTRALCAM